MDGGTITGIIQCCLAVVAIAVDIFLAVFAGQFVKDRKEKQEKIGASAAIDAVGNLSITPVDNEINNQNNAIVTINKSLKKKAKGVLQKLKRKQKNTYPRISAISLVIAFKVLYDGNESLVVQSLKAAKQRGYLTWNSATLQPSTIIIINNNKENELIEYLSTR